jgi:hypothetical protein
MPFPVGVYGHKVCRTHTFLTWFGVDFFHPLACVINANDPRYNRIKSLESLSGDYYKQDYISGNLGDHILKGERRLHFRTDFRI